MATVMVVDDDPRVREVLVAYLKVHDHRTFEAADGETALSLMEQTQPDLVVLDLMLPGIDGLEVTRRLRTHSDVPIIMLTALGAEADRVLGLELGADDYVGKPFSPRELALRVDSVLRRAAEPGRSVDQVAVDGNLVVDGTRHLATLDGIPLALTLREFDLLHFLISHPGIAYTREDLLQHVWDWTIGDRTTVTVHVRRLREKIEVNPTVPCRLLTVWGVGYRWEPQA